MPLVPLAGAALIVFEDADIEKAVEWACFGVFWTCGQVRLGAPQWAWDNAYARVCTLCGQVLRLQLRGAGKREGRVP